MRRNGFSTAIGLLSILLGATMLLGWAFGSELVTGFGPGQSTMKANTALCFSGLGVALLVHGRGALRVRASAALLALVVGATTVVEYVTRTRHGIDELVFVDPDRGQAGRMGINSAVAFCLLGMTLLLLRSGRRRPTLAAHGCAIGALTIGFLAVMGYVNGVKGLYGPASLTAMALPTAVFVILLSLALLAASSAYGLPATVLAPTAGGRMARRLLPVAGVPIVLHLLRSRAEQAGLVSTNVGVWIVAMFVVATLVLAAVLVAKVVDRSEESRELLATVVESSNEAIITITAERIVTTWNHGAERLYGWSADEVLGKSVSALGIHESRPDELIERTRAGEHIVEHETVRLRRDGSRVVVAVSVWPLRDASGTLTGFASVSRDIGERREAQRRLLEARKLESLSVLAGGIAHDFNNLLHGILGYASLALSALPPHSPVRQSLEEIEIAGTRAAELARDMLAYSGTGRFVVQPVDLRALVKETGRLVPVEIAGAFDIAYRLEDGLPAIEADAAQIRQVVMNLVTNAAEALGTDGGSIEVRADLVDALPSDGFHFADELLPGPYVRLEVEDSGAGMSAETLAHLFDPFFTTKFTGRGLGLAAVLGIVRGHRGAIRVTSDPGLGTVFTLLFPCAPSAVIAPREAVVTV